MKILFLILSFTLASQNQSARVVIDRAEPEHVCLAAEDLISDVRKIAGIQLQAIRSSRPRKGDVYIKTVADGQWETYRAGIGEDGILHFTGGDSRGTMFAIYDFCEQYLKVDPMGYWNGTPWPRADKLEWDDVHLEQKTPSFKFRGWFINDEDLLTGWKKGGTRHTTYTWYHTVISPEIMEHIAESLVRSRFNLIIPSSFIWIQNPPEKELIDICSKRGVFLSMHHVEPLGVSAFSFEYFWAQRGKQYNFSYWSNPDKIDRLWQESVKEWAKYPNVIWQTGLRGIADRPMWDTDKNTPIGDRERSEIISNAMARQIDILDQAGIPKESRYVSTTLWAEGSVFFDKGYLKIPEGTIIIFADNSPGWCWQEDFRNTKREDKYKYGVYYHHALIGAGPHLASLIPVEKTFELMKEAYNTGTNEYAILNVSNIREFSYNIDASSKMLWQMDTFNPESWQRNWLRHHFSVSLDEWMSVYNAYYHCLQIHPGNKIPAFLDGQIYSRSEELISRMNKSIAANPKGGQMARESFEKAKDSEGSDGIDAFWKSMSMNGHQSYLSSLAELSQISAQAASYQMVKERCEALLTKLPLQEQAFAYTTIVYPSNLMYYLSSWYRELVLMEDSFKNGNLPLAKQYQTSALNYLSCAINLESQYCTGQFEGYWNECLKINLKGLHNRLSALTVSK